MKVVSVLTRQVYHFVFDDISPPHPRVSCSLQVPSKSQSHFSQACGVYLASDGIYWSTKPNTFTSHTRIPPVWSTLFQFFQDIRMILIGISIVGLISFLIHSSESFDCCRFLDGILEKRDERLRARTVRSSRADTNPMSTSHILEPSAACLVFRGIPWFGVFTRLILVQGSSFEAETFEIEVLVGIDFLRGSSRLPIVWTGQQTWIVVQFRTILNKMQLFAIGPILVGFLGRKEYSVRYVALRRVHALLVSRDRGWMLWWYSVDWSLHRFWRTYL